jgi:hypothetical protein
MTTPVANDLNEPQSPTDASNLSLKSSFPGKLMLATPSTPGHMSAMDSIGSDVNICFISQSPKVLVSNHQLVSDLCNYTQNQLKLNSNGPVSSSGICSQEHEKYMVS